MNRPITVTMATLLTLATALVGLTAWLVSLQMETRFLDRQVQVLRTRIERLEARK